MAETNPDQLDTIDRLVETNAERIDKHFFTGRPEVNVVLEANQAQLDEHFIKVLRDRSSAMLSEVQPEEKKALAASIIALSLCIREFKQGNEANNLEIEITGYEIAATVLTHESTPEMWADCQMFFWPCLSSPF